MEKTKIPGVQLDLKFDKESFSNEEISLVNDIFGLFVKNVYFKLVVDEKIRDTDRIVNFFGISGAGKTIIKDALKEQVVLDPEVNTLDFDEISDQEWMSYKDKTIIELLDIRTGEDEILKIISGFGLFEMRILLTPIKLLSQGQQTRLKYIFLLNQIKEDQENYVFIDECLTYVDSLSATSFSKTLAKYLKGKPVRLYTFGVNDALIGQFEDVTFVLGNAGINAEIRNGEIEYKDDYIDVPNVHKTEEW